MLSGAKCVRRFRAGVPAACLMAARGILRRSAHKPPQSRHPFARFARKGLPLYERKLSRRIRDRSEARERFADRATLYQLSAESWESSKKTMQSGLKSANIVVLFHSGGEQAVRRPFGVRANASTEKLFRVFRAQHCNRRESAVRKDQRWTLPDASPPARAVTSATETML